MYFSKIEGYDEKIFCCVLVKIYGNDCLLFTKPVDDGICTFLLIYIYKATPHDIKDHKETNDREIKKKKKQM